MNPILRITLAILFILTSLGPACLLEAGQAAMMLVDNYTETFQENTYKWYASRADWNTAEDQLGLQPYSGGAHREPTIAPDGRGGLYVAWSDLRNNQSNGDWDVYAQHLDSRGNRLWNEDLRVNSDTAASYQGVPQVKVDAAGNAIIGWIDDRSQPQGLSAQKVSPEGTKLWGAADVRVNSPTSFRLGWGSSCWSMALDRQGNLWVAFQAAPYVNWAEAGIFIQRISSEGAKYWVDDVRAHISPVYEDGQVGNTTLGMAVNDAGQAVVAWMAKDQGTQEIYAQAVDQGGTLLWKSDLQVNKETGLFHQGNPAVAFTTSQHAVITWRRGPQDPPLDSENSLILAQKIDLHGNLLWAGDMRVNQDTMRAFRGHPQLVGAGGESVIAVWVDSRRGLGTLDIMAQQIGPDGIRVWSAGDRRVNPEAWMNWNIKPAVYTADGLMQIAWNTDDDVFAQQINLTTWQPRWPVPMLANQTDGKRDQLVPHLASFDSDSSIAVWQEFRGNTSDIIALRIDHEGAGLWTNPIQVNNVQVMDKRQNPRTAVNHNGIALVVWQSEKGGIFGQSIDPSGNKRWTEDRKLTGVTALAYNPDIITLPDGSFLVTWIQNRENEPNLWDVMVQRFDGEGRSLFASDRKVNPEDNFVYDIDARSRPALAVDAQDHFVVAWRQNSGMSSQFSVQRFSVNGIADWQTPVAFAETPYDVNGYFENYGLAVAASSEIYVASAVIKEGVRGIYLNKLSLAGEMLWQPGVWAGNGTSPNFWGDPSLAIDSNGNIVVCWDDENVGQRNVSVQRFDNSGQIIGSTNHANQSGSWPMRPVLAKAGASSYLVIWQDERLGDNNIFLRRLDADAAPMWVEDRALIQNELYYYAMGVVESTTIDTTAEIIPRATLNVVQERNGGRVQYFLSNNGGQHWAEVQPGVRHSFTTAGSDLRWKVILYPSSDFRQSPSIDSLSIRYVDNLSGDIYEPDDACWEAQPISADGSLQQHTFYQHGDEDWITFQSTAGNTYVIQTSATQARADTTLGVYKQCGGQPIAGDSGAFGQEARVTWTANTTGPVYVKVKNTNPSAFGAETGYDFSVRTYLNQPVALIVTGYDADYSMQANIQYSGDLAYKTLVNAGVPKKRIRYLGYGESRDVDGNGMKDDIYAAPSPAAVQEAILQWAVETGVASGVPFYIYLMDHGLTDRFKVNGNSTENILHADELNLWLTNLENRTRADQITVIIEACKSGSFITHDQNMKGSISGQNRVIIASTNDVLNSFPSLQGAVFADSFWTAISENKNLEAAFIRGRSDVQKSDQVQVPWLDDNGDGVANALDGAVARSRGLGGHFAGSAPQIQVVSVQVISDNQATLQAEVRDDSLISRVWVMVIPPDYIPPDPLPDGSIPPFTLPVYELSTQNGNLFEASIGSLTKTGFYRVIFYALDEDGYYASPQSIRFCPWCTKTYLSDVRR